MEDFWKSIFIFLCGDIFVTTRQGYKVQYFSLSRTKSSQVNQRMHFFFVSMLPYSMKISTELLPWQAESGAPMENVVTCRSLASSSRHSSPRAGEVWSLDPLMVAVSRYEGSLRLILIQSLSQVHHLALL